ncbi:MAG: 4'-phosphopantetheinyl transferase superfamily protein [Planctomycetota bacterium]
MRSLGPSDVHVFEVPVEPSCAEEARAGLSSEERAKADRFHFERDRLLYSVAHAALRRVLAPYAGCAPHELRFEIDEHGRPFLTPRGELHFSLSHSGDRALVAVARVQRVGVDVEVFRALQDLDRLAERNYTPAELAELAPLEDDARVRAFFRVWTRKEAYVKALGRGLSHPLAAFDVSAGEEARFGAFRDGSERERWTLLDLPLDGERAGALAVELPDPAVRRERFAL